MLDGADWERVRTLPDPFQFIWTRVGHMVQSWAHMLNYAFCSEMALMIPMVRGAVLKGVQSCAAQGCSKESSDGGPLLRCAK